MHQTKKPITVYNASPTAGVLNKLMKKSASTDVAYMNKTLTRLGQFVPLDFKMNESKLDSVRVDGARIRNRLPVIGKKTGLPMDFRVRHNVNADVIYAYGCSVQASGRKPVVYQDVFCKFWCDGAADADDIDYKVSAIESATVITTWAQHSVDVFRDRFPQFAQKIRVVTPFMPWLSECFISPEDKQKLKLPGDPVKFVFVGGEAKRKGLETVIKAWNSLPEKLKKSAHLAICSSFADGEIDLPTDVEYRGFEKNVPAVFKKSDVMVMPSKRESYGFVFAEAAAAGCAIIAPDDGMRRSMLPADGTKFVQPDGVEEMRDAMVSMITDREYLKRAQEAQYANAMANFEPSHSAQLHYDAFSDAIKAVG